MTKEQQLLQEFAEKWANNILETDQDTRRQNEYLLSADLTALIDKVIEARRQSFEEVIKEAVKKRVINT